MHHECEHCTTRPKTCMVKCVSHQTTADHRNFLLNKTCSVVIHQIKGLFQPLGQIKLDRRLQTKTQSGNLQILQASKFISNHRHLIYQELIPNYNMVLHSRDVFSKDIFLKFNNRYEQLEAEPSFRYVIQVQCLRNFQQKLFPTGNISYQRCFSLLVILPLREAQEQKLDHVARQVPRDSSITPYRRQRPRQVAVVGPPRAAAAPVWHNSLRSFPCRAARG